MNPRLAFRPTRPGPLVRLCILCTVLVSLAALAQDDFYQGQQPFQPAPDPTGARYELKRFGPVGIGLELIQPAFTMRITHVEEGSPAAATGALKKGQIIASINGQVLKDIDPRIILGNLITEAEATDGKMRLMVKDSPKAAAREVVVSIPVMGPYSDTWPVDCPKSDRIVREFADFLAERDQPNWGAVLFLLSTGEQQDLDVVTRWLHDKLPADKKGIPWEIGYTGPAICEYYLRTGDESVLPAIKSMTEYLKSTIYNGSWMGRGGANYKYMAGGHMNAAGVHCVTFLLLAKECGVDVDEHTMMSAMEHFYRFAGRGNVAYGDGLPEGGMVDNGRTGGLAFAMAAAATLTPEGEDSVYADARDISATKAFYSTSWLFHGHTGGGIGELWRGASMGLVKDKRPEAYRSFMDDRRWMYELARTHDGAFGWVSGWNVSYEDTGHTNGRSWGNYIPLIYTIPRQKLRIFGAPATEFSHTYQLPKRPWGTAADDVFYSLEAGEYAPGKRLDMRAERLETHASLPISSIISAPDVTDETLLAYAHHIDQGIRAFTATTIVKRNRDHLIVPLLKSPDPRGRHTAAHAIAGQFKGQALPANRLTDEMVELLLAMVEDPDESWWCVNEALLCLGNAKPERIAPHIDRLTYWLQHDEWWLRKAALVAITPIASDKRYYDKILPIMGDMVAANERAVALMPVSGIVEEMRRAEPVVQKKTVEELAQAYLDYPETLAAPGGQDMSAAVDYMLDGIARNLANTPGGFDVLFEVSQKRFPEQPLPHKELYLQADSKQFGPTLRKAFMPILTDELIPAYIETNRKALERELKNRQPDRAVAGLVDLYQRAGVTDYDWQLFGPEKTAIDWQYHSFDPTDGTLWEDGGRYRPVDWPAGMATWYEPSFDAQAAGWKTGRAPFGHNDGTTQVWGSCVGNFCGCGEPIATFWEKEVLMMRAAIKLPPLQEGYAYRLLVGGRSHVNWGDGSDIWIDGVYLAARRKNQPSLSGVGKRQGGQPWGAVLDQDFRQQMQDRSIVLAASGFLRYRKGSREKANRQSFWFEAMKLPTIPPAEADEQ